MRAFITDALSHSSRLAVLGMEVPDPTGYGRFIVDGSCHLKGIVEEKDATAAEKLLGLCNSGVMFAETAFLFSLLQQLRADNQQQEYYLTDCIALAYKQGQAARFFVGSNWRSFLGVNTPQQLAAMERYLEQRN